MTDTKELVIGWRAIGAAVGRPAGSLATQASMGSLPVQPIKIGNQVAMTQEQIEILKQRRK